MGLELAGFLSRVAPQRFLSGVDISFFYVGLSDPQLSDSVDDEIRIIGLGGLICGGWLTLCRIIARE